MVLKLGCHDVPAREPWLCPLKGSNTITSILLQWRGSRLGCVPKVWISLPWEREAQHQTPEGLPRCRGSESYSLLVCDIKTGRGSRSQVDHKLMRHNLYFDGFGCSSRYVKPFSGCTTSTSTGSFSTNCTTNTGC